MSLSRRGLADLAAGHRLGFAGIIAGGNIAAAVVTAGVVLSGELTAPGTWVMVLLLAASLLAAALAYYSLQVGSILPGGPLRLREVVSLFLIASAQFALFGFLIAVASRTDRDASSTVQDLRHWFLLAAVFALASAYGNHADLRARRSQAAAGTPTSEAKALLENTEGHQRADIRTALLGGVVWLAAWGATTFWPQDWLIGTLALVTMMPMAFALLNQDRAMQDAWSQLPPE